MGIKRSFHPVCRIVGIENLWWHDLRATLISLVGARGFEPPTSRSQTERTTRLCYAPKSLWLRSHQSMVKHSKREEDERSSLAQEYGRESHVLPVAPLRGD